MQAERLNIGTGLSWITAGWSGFAANPVVWVVQAILFFIIALLLELIPHVGQLAYSLLAPTLTAGLLYTAREAHAGNPLRVQHLFRGFTEPGRLAPLVILGALFTVIWIVVALLVLGLLTTVMGSVELLGADSDADHLPPAALGGVGILTLGVIATLVIGVFLCLAFATPLVMFRGSRPLQGIRKSTRAVVRNLAPLSVTVLVYVMLGALAMIPFGLGLVIVLPMSIGSLYAGFHDIFPSSTSDQEPGVPAPEDE